MRFPTSRGDLVDAAEVTAPVSAARESERVAGLLRFSDERLGLTTWFSRE